MPILDVSGLYQSEIAASGSAEHQWNEPTDPGEQQG